MKKIVLIIFLIVFLFVLSGCTATVEKATEIKRSDSKIMIQMPDGSVVSGICSDRWRTSNGWAVYLIDGKKYRCHEWRVVIIDEEDALER